jgi:ornithine--oxo-acid transaminase
MGDYMMTKLGQVSSPYVKEIRGQGLVVGIELHEEAGGALRTCDALMARGLLCEETRQHVIRLAPPLIIQQNGVDWA